MDCEAIPLPRENEGCIMERLVEVGVRGDKLLQINWCRI